MINIKEMITYVQPTQCLGCNKFLNGAVSLFVGHVTLSSSLLFTSTG